MENLFTTGLIVLLVLTTIIAVCEVLDLDEKEAFDYVSKKLTDNIIVLRFVVPCYLTYQHWVTQVVCRLSAVVSIGLIFYVSGELLHTGAVMADFPYIISYLFVLIALFVGIYLWILIVKLSFVTFALLAELLRWIFSVKKFLPKDDDDDDPVHYPSPSTQDDADLD
ncbi:MAG: hypothetical protein J6N45_08905 [Alphaproteobacteria bacterium]|nr:hypothetical protein [Alphaproteobacteria bacterium]